MDCEQLREQWLKYVEITPQAGLCEVSCELVLHFVSV